MWRGRSRYYEGLKEAVQMAESLQVHLCEAGWKSPPQLHPSAVDMLSSAVWQLLRMPILHVPACCQSGSWDTLLNVLLHPDHSGVGVGGWFLPCLLCGVTRSSWKGHRMWPCQLWYRLLETFWHYSFYLLIRKYHLFLTAQEILGEKKNMLYQNAWNFLLPSFKEWNGCFLILK